jgi:hypothetical protein
MDAARAVLATSVAAKFTTDLPLSCSVELAQHLRRYPESWHSLPPKSLERLVADLFRANHKACEVIHIGRPGDRGIDVIFIDDNNTTWLVQVKGRSRPGRSEGFSTLQSILGTLALEGKRHGIIATTADYFSRQAHQECRRARQQGLCGGIV